MHLKFFNKNMFYVLGDTHGSLPDLKSALLAIKSEATWDNYKAHESGPLAVVQLGDFGFVFNGDDQRNDVNALCAELNVALFALRGNHDDPAAWGDDWVGNPDPAGDGAGLHMLRDGVYGSVVVVGGAYSIDRTYRTEGKTWYKGELVNSEHVDAIRALVHDPRYLLLSHEARSVPPGAKSGVVELYGGDPKLADAERFKLQQLPRPAWHVHGHWHRGQAYYADDGVPTLCMAHADRPSKVGDMACLFTYVDGTYVPRYEVTLQGTFPHMRLYDPFDELTY